MELPLKHRHDEDIDRYGRPLQTVTLYPDGSVLTASTKYRYEDLPQRQVARLSVPQGNCLANADLSGSGSNQATDTLNAVLTETFTYDKRGRMLTSNATMHTFNSFVQSGNLAYSDTLSSEASATYSYDELGHLTGKTLGGNLSQTLAYNIQDWMTTTQTKKGTANVFSQTLRYYNPVKPSTTALYSGNISEWESVQGTSTASTYGFTYDTQGRLTSSDRYNGTSTAATQLYTERNISYDRNGNILALKRISNSIPSPLHNFSYSYDGDKLTTLSGSQSGTSFTSAYLYDGNGNMTLDGNQAARLSYDINNLVHSAKKTATGQSPNPSQDEFTANYSYFADGTKYSIKDTAGNGRIYIGPFTLARKEYPSANSGNTTVQHITLLESADVLGSDARFAFAATPQNPSGTDTTYTVAYETLYLLKDHLESVRTITDSQGNALERNDYYPYGLQTSLGRNYATLGDKYRVRMPTSFTSGNPDISSLSVSSPSFEMSPLRMLYNGKELQMIAQTSLIDYGARQYDPTIARWKVQDPLSESYYNESLFAFCSCDPINFTDIYGLETDWVQKPSGDIVWDPNAISPETTSSGDIYIGPSFQDLEYRYNSNGTKNPVLHKLQPVVVQAEATPHGRTMMNPVAQAVWASQKAFMDHPITQGTIDVLMLVASDGIIPEVRVSGKIIKHTINHFIRNVSKRNLVNRTVKIILEREAKNPHIFKEKHNLYLVMESGEKGKKKFLKQVVSKLIKNDQLVSRGGVFDDMIIEINSHKLAVHGRFINGKPIISTMYVIE